MLASVSAVLIGKVTRYIHSSGETPAAASRPESRKPSMRVGPSKPGAGRGPRSSRITPAYTSHGATQTARKVSVKIA